MSDEKNESLYKIQKKSKPQIEEVFLKYLEGDTKKAALDFVSYMRENKMAPTWASANSWKCSYKGKGVCYIRTHGTAWKHTSDTASWSITLYGDYVYGDMIDQYNNFVVNKNYQNIIWNNRALKKCHRCQPQKCASNGNEAAFTGFRMVFYGKTFENVCRNGDTSFSDSDERTIAYIKGAIGVLCTMRKTKNTAIV